MSGIPVDTLKIEALEACGYRGHTMGQWDDFTIHGGPASRCKCAVCGMDVQVEEKPSPNSIDIGGQAVALNCS